MGKVFIIDGHNLLFRMFYGMPNKIYSKSGNCIHGIIGFIGAINKMIKEYKPDSLIVVFDSQEGSAKMEDERYKKNRILDFSHLPDDENPFSQFEDIIKCLDLLGITHIEIPGQEADDIICTLAKQYSIANEVVIVSTDKDFLQVINNQINVLSPRGKLSILYTPNVFYEKFGIQVCQYTDFKVLVGDPSDNIDGIFGIGNKTAVNLLTQFGTLDNVYENLGLLSVRVVRLLVEGREKVQKNSELLKINSDIELNISLCDLGYLANFKTMDIVNKVVEDEQMLMRR